MVWVTLSIQTKISILDNSMREKNMEKETTSSARERSSVAYGNRIRKLKENSHYSTVMCSMAALKTMSVTKGNIGTKMEMFMKEHGRMI